MKTKVVTNYKGFDIIDNGNNFSVVIMGVRFVTESVDAAYDLIDRYDGGDEE